MHPQVVCLRNNRFVRESGKREWILLGVEGSEAIELEDNKSLVINDDNRCVDVA